MWQPESFDYSLRSLAKPYLWGRFVDQPSLYRNIAEPFERE